jgi:hypothetical protein
MPDCPCSPTGEESPKDYYRTLKLVLAHCSHPITGGPKVYGNHRRKRGYVYYVDKWALYEFLKRQDRRYYRDRFDSIVSRLYKEGIFKDLPSSETNYYKSKTFLADVDRSKLHSTIYELQESLKKPAKEDIEVTYTLGGMEVSEEYYRKYSSRFTNSEKGVSYTFRGSEVPEDLNLLIESVLADS